MENCKSISTPLMQNVKLSKDQSNELIDEGLHGSLIGCLMYFTATRLDILFVVSLRSRFTHCAKGSHFKAAKGCQDISDVPLIMEFGLKGHNNQLCSVLIALDPLMICGVLIDNCLALDQVVCHRIQKSKMLWLNPQQRQNR